MYLCCKNCKASSQGKMTFVGGYCKSCIKLLDIRCKNTLCDGVCTNSKLYCSGCLKLNKKQCKKCRKYFFRQIKNVKQNNIPKEAIVFLDKRFVCTRCVDKCNCCSMVSYYFKSCKNCNEKVCPTCFEGKTKCSDCNKYNLSPIVKRKKRSRQDTNAHIPTNSDYRLSKEPSKEPKSPEPLSPIYTGPTYDPESPSYQAFH